MLFFARQIFFSTWMIFSLTFGLSPSLLHAHAMTKETADERLWPNNIVYYQLWSMPYTVREAFFTAVRKLQATGQGDIEDEKQRIQQESRFPTQEVLLKMLEKLVEASPGERQAFLTTMTLLEQYLIRHERSEQSFEQASEAMNADQSLSGPDTQLLRSQLDEVDKQFFCAKVNVVELSSSMAVSEAQKQAQRKARTINLTSEHALKTEQSLLSLLEALRKQYSYEPSFSLRIKQFIDDKKESDRAREKLEADLHRFAGSDPQRLLGGPLELKTVNLFRYWANEKLKKEFIRTIRFLEKYTYLHFIGDDSKDDRLMVYTVPLDAAFPQALGSADSGRTHNGMLRVVQGNENHKVIVHEILHVLGFLHEDARVRAVQKGNKSMEDYLDHGPLDPFSIMHQYATQSISLEKIKNKEEQLFIASFGFGDKLIESFDGRFSGTLSSRDIAAINRFYPARHFALDFLRNARTQENYQQLRLKADPDKCLAIKQSKKSNHSRQTWVAQCDPLHIEQYWRFTGKKTLHNLQYPHECLDTQKDQSSLLIKRCGHRLSQQWELNDDTGILQNQKHNAVYVLYGYRTDIISVKSLPTLSPEQKTYEWIHQSLPLPSWSPKTFIEPFFMDSTFKSIPSFVNESLVWRTNGQRYCLAAAVQKEGHGEIKVEGQTCVSGRLHQQWSFNGWALYNRAYPGYCMTHSADHITVPALRRVCDAVHKLSFHTVDDEAQKKIVAPVFTLLDRNGSDVIERRMGLRYQPASHTLLFSAPEHTDPGSLSSAGEFIWELSKSESEAQGERVLDSREQPSAVLSKAARVSPPLEHHTTQVLPQSSSSGRKITLTTVMGANSPLSGWLRVSKNGQTTEERCLTADTKNQPWFSVKKPPELYLVRMKRCEKTKIDDRQLWTLEGHRLINKHTPHLCLASATLISHRSEEAGGRAALQPCDTQDPPLARNWQFVERQLQDSDRGGRFILLFDDINAEGRIRHEESPGGQRQQTNYIQWQFFSPQVSSQPSSSRMGAMSPLFSWLHVNVSKNNQTAEKLCLTAEENKPKKAVTELYLVRMKRCEKTKINARQLWALEGHRLINKHTPHLCLASTILIPPSSKKWDGRAALQPCNTQNPPLARNWRFVEGQLQDSDRHARFILLFDAKSEEVGIGPAKSPGGQRPKTNYIQWQFSPVVSMLKPKPSSFTIQNGGRCLTAPSAPWGDGMTLFMSSCEGLSTQQWQFDDKNRLKNNAVAGMCLDWSSLGRPRRAEGGYAVLQKCSLALEQKWSELAQGVLQNGSGRALSHAQDNVLVWEIPSVLDGRIDERERAMLLRKSQRTGE